MFVNYFAIELKSF